MTAKQVTHSVASVRVFVGMILFRELPVSLTIFGNFQAVKITLADTETSKDYFTL